MSYTLTIEIQEDSPQSQNIEAVVEGENITREEAALHLLATTRQTSGSPRSSVLADEEERRAAVKALTGSLKGTDWSVHDFNDEKNADIERENERDII